MKNRWIKKTISLFLALLMAFSVMPAGAITAQAAFYTCSCGKKYTFLGYMWHHDAQRSERKEDFTYTKKQIGTEYYFKPTGEDQLNHYNRLDDKVLEISQSEKKTWTYSGSIAWSVLKMGGSYSFSTTKKLGVRVKERDVPPGQYARFYIGSEYHVYDITCKQKKYCFDCGRYLKTITTHNEIRVPVNDRTAHPWSMHAKYKEWKKGRNRSDCLSGDFVTTKVKIDKVTKAMQDKAKKYYKGALYNYPGQSSSGSYSADININIGSDSKEKIKSNSKNGKTSKVSALTDINATTSNPSGSINASVSLLSGLNSIISIFKPMTVYAASRTIRIPKGTTLIITGVSNDGNYGKTSYKGTTCWVNLNYVGYVFPTITKPEPPEVTLKTAQDIPLGGLITVDWNTPTDANYFSAVLKDESGKEVERYNNIYGNTATFQSQNPGKYTVEVIAHNSEYSSDPGKLGKYVTVHDFVNITFKDEDGTELGTEKIPWGDNAVSLIAPEKRGHTFKGWSGSLFNVKNDITVTAQYDKAKYTVEFIGYQANEQGIPNKEVLLKKETVEFGSDAAVPTDDEIVVPKNYEFMGWSSEEYKNVYTPYKNESIKIYAVYGWKNKDLPIDCDLTSAVRQSNGYYVYYNLQNYPDAVTRGRVIVALKTSEGKLIDMTESSAFSLEKSETETGAKIFIPCEKAATTAEIYVVNGYTNNGMSDGIPISNKDSVTIVEGKMWSDWVTTPIAENADNVVESREEYSFRNLRETTGNTKIKPDWVTLMSDGVIKKGNEYTARLNDTSYIQNGTVKRTDNSASVSWSGWSWNQVAAFDTESKRRDIETKREVVSYNYKTQWRYSHWTNGSTSNGHASMNNASQHYTDWLDYQKVNRGAGNGDVRYGDSYSVWGYCGNCGRSYFPWYNEETRQVATSANYGTQWRYRDCTYTYYFYRWEDKDWSDWSADEVTSTDKREVQTRTVYREKSVSAGIEDVSGETRTFSGTVDTEFAGKNITFFVSKYNAISDFTDEYVAQSTIGEDGSYTFNYKLREEPTAETGDFTIMIGIEGTTEKQVVGTIEAPKPVYTVKYYGDVKDNNPEVIYEARVRQGETAELPEENPEIVGKRFICWNNSCTNIQGDMEIYPVFEDEKYTVIFVDWRTQRIETQKYKYGEPLAPPTIEYLIEDENGEEQTLDVEVEDVESGYGRGWDYEEGTLVTSDMVVTAQYETKMFDVTFHDYDGTVIDTQTVEYGGVAETPELSNDENDGIEYYDWESDMDELYNVKDNLDVFPIYKFDKVTPNPTASVETGAYDDSQTVALNCEDENAVIYYTTDGSEPKDNFDAVEYTAPITISSKTELKFYASSMGKNDSEVVTESYVINNDGLLISMYNNIDEDGSAKTYLVNALKDINYEVLLVEGYTLDGIYYDSGHTQLIDDNNNTTKGAIELYAKYSINTYSVTFEKEDGTVIDSQSVAYLESAEEPSVADEGTLKFVGWDTNDWIYVTEDVTVHPVFKEKSEIVSVTFDKAKYQMELDSTYQINATITAPDNEEYENLNDAVIWCSDNEEVATVDNTGVVTSVGSGTAKIYAISVDNINSAVCEITVKPSVNNSILINNLSSLDVDSEGYIRRVPLDGTNTVDFFNSQFINSHELLTFTNAKGNTITGTDKVGTNTVIALTNGDKVLDSMTVVMTGDVTCDGAVNNRDVSYAARVIVKRNTADAGQLRAMDVNGDGKVNNRDVAMLSRYLVGKEQIAN